MYKGFIITNRKTSIIFVAFMESAIVLAIGGSLWLNHAKYVQSAADAGSQNGMIIFSFSSSETSASSIVAMNIVVDSAYVHSDKQGWIMISDTPQTFSLYELKNKAHLFGKVELKADTYDQIWFRLRQVTVQEKGRAKGAFMPSPDFKITSRIKVAENSSTSVNAEIVMNESFSVDQKNQVVFSPVIYLKSQSQATVGINNHSLVTVSGGVTDSDLKIKILSDSLVQNNLEINPSVKTINHQINYANRH